MHWITLTQLNTTGKERRSKPAATPRYLNIAVATVAWCLLTLSAVCGLEIKDLRVPTGVQSGSPDPLVLDCDYVYEDREKNGLVVKWYRETGPSDNKTTQQVYQWITSLPPQDLGVLKGRLDIHFEASPDPFSKYRALRILQPTINLTGDYKCHVSSNYNDAIKSQKMIIYSPAREMILQSAPLSGTNRVNVSCAAEGIFPEPYAEMIITKGRKTTHAVINNTTQIVTANEGLYDITVYKVFDETLAAGTQFECVLKVPDTKYSLRKSFVYYPGNDFNLNPEADSASIRLSNKNRESSLTGTEQPATVKNDATVLSHWHTGRDLVLLNYLFLFFYLWTLVV